MAASNNRAKSTRALRKNAELSRMFIKEEVRARCKKITEILKKPDEDRTVEDKRLLELSPDVAKDILKRHKSRKLAKERQLEVEDERSDLIQKSIALADAIQKSKSLVIYTGAGISTAASIPDYRGPNGVWTLLQQGKEIKAQDLSDAEPTYTHMAVTQLFHEKKLRHVVSQNCDGLHVRSGLPCYILSEVHGNMYLEICTECNPQREYMRLFDVTEKTGVRRHKTGRHCHRCKAHLRDTIVHFGEKSPNKDSPYNWEEAADAAEDADLVICLGTSLKILKKYSCLWHTHLPASQRPDLFIVNLMWTPKDDAAAVKINGRCDDVMKIVMQRLGYHVPKYDKFDDPIFRLATALKPDEVKTTSKKILGKPESRTSTTAEYYGVDSSLEAELKEFGEKEQNNSRRRRRVKPDFYDPDTPTKATIKRVRTKAELKQEPPGQVRPEDGGFVPEAVPSGVKSEPGLPAISNSSLNTAALSLPCIPPDLTFNPLAQVPFSGVPWMLPGMGLMSSALSDPLLMYAGGMPGLVPPYLPQQSANTAPSGFQDTSAPLLTRDHPSNMLSENMHEHLLSSTAAEIRKTKKRKQKKSSSVPENISSVTSIENHSVENPYKHAYDAVAREHSYTMPPHAMNTKLKHSKPLPETFPDPESRENRATIQTDAYRNSTESLVEGVPNPNKSSKRCPTIKHLLEKPPVLKGEPSQSVSLSTSQSANIDFTTMKASVSSLESEPPKVRPNTDTCDNPKLSNVPSITHAIEMVKLHQQGVLNKDSGYAVKSKNFKEESVLPSSSHTSKNVQILSQLASPPIAPVPNVKSKAQTLLEPEEGIKATLTQPKCHVHQSNTSKATVTQPEHKNQLTVPTTSDISAVEKIGAGASVDPVVSSKDNRSQSPVITTQALQQALVQLNTVSSIAIPPNVANLVLSKIPNDNLMDQTPKCDLQNNVSVAPGERLSIGANRKAEMNNSSIPKAVNTATSEVTTRSPSNHTTGMLQTVQHKPVESPVKLNSTQAVAVSHVQASSTTCISISNPLPASKQQIQEINPTNGIEKDQTQNSAKRLAEIPLQINAKPSLKSETTGAKQPHSAFVNSSLEHGATSSTINKPLSPVKRSRKREPSAQPSPVHVSVPPAVTVMSPVSHHGPLVSPPINHGSRLFPEMPSLSSAEQSMHTSNVLGNTHLSQAYLHGMNQAFNAHILSQMGMAQFGSLAQIPNTPPYLNPFMHDPLLQGNLALMSQVQAQMLASPLGLTGSFPVVDPNLLDISQLGGVTTQSASIVRPQTLVDPSTTQGNTAQQSVTSAHTYTKPKESLCNKSESQPGTSEDVKTASAKMASENFRDSTSMVDATKKLTHLGSTTSHLKSPEIESKNSGVLPGSKVDGQNNRECKRKDRSESQDSNSAASDSTADSESPVSTPTTTSAPGWFGKGLNIRKGRRKRLK